MIFRDLAKIFQKKMGFNIFAVFKALKVAEQRLAEDKPQVREILYNTSVLVFRLLALAEQLKDTCSLFQSLFSFLGI